MKLPSHSELRTLIRQLSEIEATFENAFVGLSGAQTSHL